MFYELLNAFDETLCMVLISGLFTFLFGLPLGVLLYLLSYKKQFWQKFLYHLLQGVIKTASSIPYLIFVILLIPLLRFLFGSEALISAAILSLSLAAIFPFAKAIQDTLQALPKGQLDLAQSLGISQNRWVIKISLKEVFPKILQHFSYQINQLVGYSVIAGVFGAGGLGGLLIEKGYDNFQLSYVFLALLLLISLTQGIRFSLQYFTHEKSR